MSFISTSPRASSRMLETHQMLIQTCYRRCIFFLHSHHPSSDFKMSAFFKLEIVIYQLKDLCTWAEEMSFTSPSSLSSGWKTTLELSNILCFEKSPGFESQCCHLMNTKPCTNYYITSVFSPMTWVYEQLPWRVVIKIKVTLQKCWEHNRSSETSHYGFYYYKCYANPANRWPLLAKIGLDKTVTYM